MTEIDPEIRAELIKCIDSGNIDQIRDILDALYAADNPNIVKAEFTISQMKDLEYVRAAIHQPTIGAVLRMMVDSFVPAFKKGQAEAKRAKS